jgi:hypothetical protein
MCSYQDGPHASPARDGGGDGDGCLSLDVLEREICELSAHMAVGMCRWLLLVAEWDERRGWAEWGVYSCAHWLSWRCSIALRAAREHVRVARRLKEMPLVTEAFAAGRLSYSKVRAISRVATPENEEYLVMLGQHATGAQLERIVSGYRRARAATVEGAQRAHEERYLYAFEDDDGSLLIQARVPADEGGLLLAALEQAECAARAERDGSAEPTSVWAIRREEGGSAEPVAEKCVPARRADALIALARTELASGGTVDARGDPVELVVHVDVETLVGDQVRDRSEVEDGPVLAPETVRRLGCDAGVVRMLERDGRPLSVGRRTRVVPPAIRRALRDRDKGCRFPGCRHRRYLHAHHIEHWARGGPTALDNLVELCSFHHRLVHEGGFKVECAGPRALRFTRPDGRRIPEVPSCPGATGAGIREQHRAWGAAVDADTCRALGAGQPLDYGMAIDGLLWRDQPPPERPPPDPAAGAGAG